MFFEKVRYSKIWKTFLKSTQGILKQENLLTHKLLDYFA